MMGLTEQDKIVLRCILNGPKWSAEIASALGYKKWSQIPNGTYHARRLASLGLCERIKGNDDSRRKRAYFQITPAGIAAIETQP